MATTFPPPASPAAGGGAGAPPPSLCTACRHATPLRKPLFSRSSVIGAWWLCQAWSRQVGAVVTCSRVEQP